MLEIPFSIWKADKVIIHDLFPQNNRIKIAFLQILCHENKAWLIVPQDNFQTSTSTLLEILEWVNSVWKGVFGAFRSQKAFEKVLH